MMQEGHRGDTDPRYMETAKTLPPRNPPDANFTPDEGTFVGDRNRAQSITRPKGPRGAIRVAIKWLRDLGKGH